MQSCGKAGLNLTRFLTSAHSCRLYPLSEHLGLILAPCRFAEGAKGRSPATTQEISALEKRTQHLWLRARRGHNYYLAPMTWDAERRTSALLPRNCHPVYNICPQVLASKNQTGGPPPCQTNRSPGTPSNIAPCPRTGGSATFQPSDRCWTLKHPHPALSAN